MKFERFAVSALAAAVAGVCALPAPVYAEESDTVYAYSVSDKSVIVDMLASVDKYSLGDVNGDGSINANDASAILMEYSLLSTGG